MPRAERHQLGDGEARRRNHPVPRGQRRAERKWREISRRPTVPCGPEGWRLRSLAFRAVAFEPPCLWALLRPKSLLTRGSRHRLTGVLTGRGRLSRSDQRLAR